MKRLRLPRTILFGALAIGVLLFGATVASADHSWNNYHFPSYNLSPTVVDSTSSSLYKVPLAVEEWFNLGTDIQPVITTASKGDITVKEAFSPFWLGLARVFLDGDHITKAEVKLNTRLLNSYGAAAADQVLCQELGHVLGLDHNRDGDDGGSPDDTCMNDQTTIGSYTSPNSHDTAQLDLIYDGHADLDPDDGGDTGGGGNCPPGNPNHKNCQNATGRWIVVHVFPIP
ncbi:MAG: hypothetical protein IIB87_02050 [Chloroflexi bacterium]|nr:hypothetical protein [Chloroflexota bacterium]